MQFCIQFHLILFTLRFDQYSLRHCEKRTVSGFISQQLNEYWLDRKVETRRWKIMQNCIFYIYIILWYNQNSNAQLEPKCWVRGNEALLYGESGQKSAGLCPVWATTPPIHTGLGSWPGLGLNPSQPQVNALTACGLPRPIAYSRYGWRNSVRDVTHLGGCIS